MAGRTTTYGSLNNRGLYAEGTSGSSSSGQSYHSSRQQDDGIIDRLDPYYSGESPPPRRNDDSDSFDEDDLFRNEENSPLLRLQRELGFRKRPKRRPPCCQGRLGLTCCWAVLLLQTAALLLVLWSFHPSSSSWQVYDVNHKADSETTNELQTFNYIVVGGGPAGILTAWKLARAFPRASVLLLESGTASQASVLKNLAHRESNSTSFRLAQDEWGLDVENTDQSALVNKFDVPLLWSGVASDKGYGTSNGNNNNNHHWPIHRTLLGRALGGSGLHNAMIYVRALPSDLELWNVSGPWTWEQLLPHYIALERYTTPSTSNTKAPFWNHNPANDTLRGTKGWVTTVPAGTAGLAAVDAVAPLFVQSALHAGHKLASPPGFNSMDPTARLGAGFYDFNVGETGVRDSIAHALLGGGPDDPPPSNLIVKTGVTVTRVLTETSNTLPTSGDDGEATAKRIRAVGVEYVQEHSSVGPNVGRFMLRDPLQSDEVILAAGCILTPQLLFNSGISDGGSLVDLPGVGKNVQDHPVIAMAYQLSPELAEQASSIYTVADEMQDYLLAVAKLQRGMSSRPKMTPAETSWLQQGLGTFGTAGFSSGAFFRSPWADDSSPDLQVTVFPRVVEPHVTRQDKKDRDREAFLRSSAMQVTVALLRPEARYEVRPSQSDQLLFRTAASYSTTGMHVDRKSPLAKVLEYRLPSIELPANATEYLRALDVKRIAWGMNQIRKIFQTPPLSKQTLDELYPGGNVTGRELRAYVRANILPNSHWCGSTKMGRDDDPMAVVDEHLRVRGVKGLRIVDSGVIPYVPNGNTHSTVCVVASRAADLLAEDRRGNKK